MIYMTPSRATGACAITADQAGDNRYAPARDATRSFQVQRATQAITFVPPDGVTLGQPVTLSASASSGLDVSYHADTPAVCTVSGATVSPATTGTCTVTVSQGGSDLYAPARDMARSFDAAPAPSGFPGVLTILLAAAVFVVAGAASVVRKVRKMRRDRNQPPEPQPTISAKPFESSPGTSVTRIKEGKS